MSNIINIGGTSGGSGSSVVPNPQGTATDTLVKLGIEGTIYNFAGGSATHNYSTTEQVVGTWIDGKTLYEKTIAVTQGSSETYISLSGLNIDTFFVESAFIQNSGGGDVSPTTYFVTSGDKFMYYYNRTNDRLVIQNSWQGSGYITIRYTKSTT